MNELFALLDFQPHPLHLVLVSFQRNHVGVGQLLVLHQRRYEEKHKLEVKVYSSKCRKVQMDSLLHIYSLCNTIKLRKN